MLAAAGHRVLACNTGSVNCNVPLMKFANMSVRDQIGRSKDVDEFLAFAAVDVASPSARGATQYGVLILQVQQHQIPVFLDHLDTKAMTTNTLCRKGLLDCHCLHFCVWSSLFVGPRHCDQYHLCPAVVVMPPTLVYLRCQFSRMTCDCWTSQKANLLQFLQLVMTHVPQQ